MIIEINGKQVEVGDDFKDLTPEEQESFVQDISGHMDAGHKSHDTIVTDASTSNELPLDATSVVAGTALAGAAANPARNQLVGMLTEESKAAPAVKAAVAAPSDLSGTERWKQSAKEINEAKKSIVQDTNIMKRAPNFSRGPGAASATTPAVGPSKAQMIAEMIGEGHPSTLKSIAKGTGKGALVGLEATDALEQLQKGNYGNAAADLTGAAGVVGQGLAKTKYGKTLGALAAIAGPALRLYREGAPEGHADGGVIQNKPINAAGYAAVPLMADSMDDMDRRLYSYQSRGIPNTDPRVVNLYKKYQSMNSDPQEGLARVKQKYGLAEGGPIGYAAGGIIEALMNDKVPAQFAKGGAVSGSHEDAIKKILSRK